MLRSELALRYACALERLPDRLAQRFIEFEADTETEQFLERAQHARAGRCRTFLHRTLCRAFSDFDTNALLDVYPMHLLGTADWRTLLGDSPARSAASRLPRLLDVGAGSGEVTATLAPLFEEVSTIEASRGMAWRLRRRGFRCVRSDIVRDGVPDAPYDVIACLNVLDRCFEPRSLLERIRDALTPDGRLVLALALPYTPFVYDGPVTRDPIEPLPCNDPEWEPAVTSLVEGVLEPLGFEVQALTRAPYLSAGDARSEVYELDDVVLVCSRAGLERKQRE